MKKYLDSAIAVMIGVFIVVGSVQAATTISENIATGGTLSVTGTSTLATTTFSGNVGIGTDDPQYKVEIDLNGIGDNAFGVGSNGYHAFTVDVTSDIVKLGDVDGLTGSAVLIVDGTDGAGKFTFENGNVGIGTTDPQNLLDIRTTSAVEFGGGESYFQFGNYAGAAHDGGLLNFVLDSGEFGNDIVFTANPEEGVSLTKGATSFSLSDNIYLGAPTVAVDGNFTVTGTINGAKVYRALLSQSGTAAPVATVLENTLGGTPIFSRSVSGVYTVSLEGVFLADKTFVRIENAFDDGNFEIRAYYSSGDDLIFILFTDSGSQSDNFTSIPFEILVYP